MGHLVLHMSNKFPKVMATKAIVAGTLCLLRMQRDKPRDLQCLISPIECIAHYQREEHFSFSLFNLLHFHGRSNLTS